MPVCKDALENEEKVMKSVEKNLYGGNCQKMNYRPRSSYR